MALELHIPTNTKLPLQYLMKEDIWSLGMSFFVLLNSEILYPYETEADQSQSYDIASLKRLISQNFCE